MNKRADIDRIKRELASALVRLLNDRHLTEEAAVDSLGLPICELRQLQSGDFDGISIDRLIEALNAFDQSVTISIFEGPKIKRDSRPLLQKIAEITASLPPEAWEKLPTDLAANHDHYLYGSPKRY